jgi:hypothetical protein
LPLGDTTAPTISITAPTTSTTYATSSATLNVSGTAADAVGVTQVSWSNDRGGSGARDRHDELELHWHHAAERRERHHGDCARCRKQHRAPIR